MRRQAGSCVELLGGAVRMCGTGGGREDLMLKSENIRFQAQY